MKFKVQHKLLEGQDIELDCPMWFGQVTVTKDGEHLERIPERRLPYKVVTASGEIAKLIVRSNFLDPVPEVKLNGEVIPLARKLHRVESLFAALPAGMFLGHGLLAVLIGYLVISTNFKILRSSWKSTFKWTTMYAISIGAFLFVRLLEQFAWSQK